MEAHLLLGMKLVTILASHQHLVRVIWQSTRLVAWKGDAQDVFLRVSDLQLGCQVCDVEHGGRLPSSALLAQHEHSQVWKIGHIIQALAHLAKTNNLTCMPCDFYLPSFESNLIDLAIW